MKADMRLIRLLKNKPLLILFTACVFLSLSSCAASQGEISEAGDDYFAADDIFADEDAEGMDAYNIYDPLEPWNRFWFSVNDFLLEYAATPLVTGYEFVVPEFARSGISNFFRNLRAPARIINCLLQGKGQEAGVEFSSFVMNSVWGLGGIFEPASSLKPVVPATGEDFGQTLGRWGAGEGPYLVLPLLGPSNVRDALGALGEFGLNTALDYPLHQALDLSWTAELSISVARGVNSLGDMLRAYNTLKDMAIDPYSALRDAYSKQRRAAAAK